MMNIEKGMNSTSESWLFVNKTPVSNQLSRSAQREKFLIHCHVQGRWRRQKAGKVDATRQIAKRDGQIVKGDASSPVESESDRSLRQQKSSHSDGSNIERHPHKLGSLEEPMNSDKDIKGTVQPQKNVMRRWPTGPFRANLPRQCLDSMDPFGAFPIQLNAEIYRLLEYYQLIFHGIMWCSPRGGVCTPCCIGIGGFLEDCFTSPLVLYSTLASMCIHMKTSLPRGAKYLYAQRAVNELRRILSRRLSDLQADKMVFAICLLWLVEASGTNLVASSVHLRGAKALIDQNPDSTSPETKHLVQKLAVQTSWTIIQTSHGRVQQSIPVLLLDGFQKYPDVEPVFLSSRYRTLVGACVQTAIGDVASLISLFEQEYLNEAELTPATCRGLYLQNAIADRNLSRAAASTPQGRVIILAVRIWKAYIFPSAGYSFPATPLANELAGLLREQPTSLWDDHIDGLMWVYTVGAMTSAHINTLAPIEVQCGMGREEVERHFLQAIVAILRRKDAQPLYNKHDNVLSAEGLRNFSRQFLYLDCVQRRIMHLLSAKIRRTIAPVEFDCWGDRGE